MSFLIIFTQYLLCCISILLTALFALNIGSVQAHTELSGVPWEYYTSLFLLLSVGICIDISKYLFWLYRKEHKLFLLLSIVLVGFSWAASIAFFVSKEDANIKQYQLESSEYTANKMTISLLELEIAEKRKLLEKRLSSSYHKQWDKGAAILNEINALTNELNQRVNALDSIGLDSAQLQLSTSALFSALSSALSMTFSSVANIAYGVLALIIEVCALGVMSLRQTVNVSHTQHKEEQPVFLRSFEEERYHKKQNKINRIRDDLLAERTKPLISNIIKDYSISHAEAKAIMKGLEDEGKLMIKRNRYYLLK